jgi:hypothetical protein
MQGLERNILIATCASITATFILYGATTMVIDSIQTSIWLMFWVGVSEYLIGFQQCKSIGVREKAASCAIALPAQGEPA